jgi:molybdopterin-guanine dinucleotide biosynthesis protein B
MKLFGIAGRCGMGKTTLLERLVPELTARGLVVSLIEHSHKSIEIDHPGKDSYRLREAGCMEVLLLGKRALGADARTARRRRAAPLGYLIGRLQRCDPVLIEGFEQGGFPRLEVWRAALGKPALWPPWTGIVAIACDAPPALPSGPLHVDQTAAAPACQPCPGAAGRAQTPHPTQNERLALAG